MITAAMAIQSLLGEAYPRFIETHDNPDHFEALMQVVPIERLGESYLRMLQRFREEEEVLREVFPGD